MISHSRSKYQAVKRWVVKPLAVLLTLAIIGAVIFVADHWDEEEAAEPRARPPVPVEVSTVETMTLAETVRGVGTLRALEQVEIRPEISARLRAIHFEEGAAVQEGQLLFELDDEKLSRQRAARQAALRGANVRAANSRRTFERQQSLREQRAGSQAEFDRAEAEYEMALAEQEQLQAELALIEEELGDTRIRSPFDGVISERQVDRGAYLSAGDTLATVYQVDPVEVTFSVPERHMGRVRRGQRVDVFVAAYPDEPLGGQIHFISPAVDEVSRTFRVRARVPNRDGRLKPGAFVTAVVTVNVREDRPVVPEEALVGTRQGYMVFVVNNDDRALARQIRTGLRRDGMVEVLDGVRVGEAVVRTGHLRLGDGDRVALAGEARREVAGPADASGALTLADDDDTGLEGGGG